MIFQTRNSLLMSWLVYILITIFVQNALAQGSRTAAVVVGSLGSLIVGAVIVILVIIFVYVRKRARKASVVKELAAQPAMDVVQADHEALTVERFLQEVTKEKPVRFTNQQLYSFTRNYSTRLGSGGFGVVYKGQFPNGVKVAVKVLKRSSNTSAEEQFMAEVSTIGKTHHVNLVRLYGFCYEPLMSSALVFEYMENGSLDKYLFGHDKQAIGGDKLRRIAIGTAKGIAYLHEECQPRIIHYDIKPGNILLDHFFFPKVADFGLARLCNRDNTHDSVEGYRGTPGYSAPEFLLNNYPITSKCDVYSFGMVLFEMVGRRRNAATVGSSDSLDWFPRQVWNEYEKGELSKIALTCEIDEKDREMVERMFKVAMWCVQDSPEARPPMSAVVKMLEGGTEIKPPSKPFQYLYSIPINTIKSSETGNGSSYSTGEETD